MIYYHGDCLDGFGAAYATWRKYRDRAAFRPMHYGQTWSAEEVAGRDVVILDFSFAADDLRGMARLARSVLQLDHHASAHRQWAGRLQEGPDGLACHFDPQLPLTVAFDLGKSGARLAWERFHPAQPLPLALAHVEDADLWRFALPGSRPFCRALRLRPFAFDAWNEIVEGSASDTSERYRSMLAEGEAIERFFASEVERLAGGTLVMPAVLKCEAADPLQARLEGQALGEGERDGHTVTGLAINASALFASELGHRLAQRSASFGLIWQLGGDGNIQVSLRADGKVNVARLAERYGGGGHPNAAGFSLPPSRFFAEVLKIASAP